MKVPDAPSLSLEVLVGSLVPYRPRLIGSSVAEVSSITEDSRQATVGTLFVARSGQKVDGARYVAAAAEQGAGAVLCEVGAGVTFEPRIEVSDLREAWGVCAQMLAGNPHESLTVVGITGTNGKTTVACLVEQALRGLGQSVGRLGTLGFFFNGQRIEGSLTTPQPDQLAKSLARVRDEGGDAMVLEVSSHALDQKRTAGVDFAVVALTNLTQDHLDYHASMEEYARAKARLFREGAPGARVLNIDDPLGRTLAAEFPTALTVSAAGTEASVTATQVDFTRLGLCAVVRVGAESYELISPLLGRHNLENLLVSWGILSALGIAGPEIVTALSAAHGVPGRLERCDGAGDDVVVVVDYAHTPDALERVLHALGELKFREVVCVFGCGGDRDRSKRALMGEVAAQGADQIYLTSDNPRTEDAQGILLDVRPGLAGARRPPVELLDRRAAIEQAVMGAAPGAVVLVAGKGHEDYQLVGDQVLRFDDRVESRRALSLRRARGNAG